MRMAGYCEMAQPTTKRRHILIVAVIIIVLVVASVAFLIGVYEPSIAYKPTSLSLSISLNQSTVIQGSNLQAQINVTSIGKAENATLSGNSGSTGLNCTFEPSMGKSNFTSTLTIHVPDSTPTGNYTIAVTASSDGQKANASFVVPVLSANVTVSGVVSVQYPSVIYFTDLQTNQTLSYSFPLTEGTLPDGYATLYSQGNSYTITLENQHTYNVTVDEKFTFLWAVFTDTFQAGTFYVYAPVGNSTLTGQNFSRPSS